jgi:hypothetical protein
MAIIVSRGGSEVTKVVETPLQKEDVLQEYVMNHPECLPLEELKDDIRLMSIGREFMIGGERIDVLAIDGDGDLYVIETKLFKNPDKRTVVAQVLDYGAALWQTYADSRLFTQAIDAKYGFRQRIGPHFGIAEEEVPAVVEAMERNLRDGAIKFVVLMNRLDDRLRNLITYLTRNSNFSFIAVEMQFYYHEGLEIVIPNLFGAEASRVKRPIASTSRPTKGSRDEFVNALSGELSSDQRAAIERLMQFAEEKEVEGRAVVRYGKQFLMVQIDDRPRSKLIDVRAMDGALWVHVREPGDSSTDTELKQKLIGELAKTLTFGAGDSRSDGGEVKKRVSAAEWTPHEVRIEQAIEVVLAKP